MNSSHHSKEFAAKLTTPVIKHGPEEPAFSLPKERVRRAPVTVVCGGVVSDTERQETLLECGDTFTLDFTNSWPEVRCSSPCSDVHTLTAGPVFRREARLEQYGLMVKQEYGKDGGLTCSLVNDITDMDELQSSLQAEACTSVTPSITTTITTPEDPSGVTGSTTTTPEGPTGVTGSTTTTPEGPTGVTGSTTTTPEGPTGVTGSTTTTPEGPTGVTDSTITTLEGPIGVTSSTTTTPEGPTGVTGSTTTSPGGTTEVSISESTITEPGSSISTVTVESTPLIGCETGSKTPTTVTPTSTESQWVCENGWSFYESSCYKVDETVKLDWLQGQIYCNDDNAEYVQITSSDEARFLKDILTSDAWIGLNDKTTEGNYVWTDGSPATFTQ
ncbi:Aggrecan core protein [Portunus trituberculatus]|uniref:Aggrecan core protein n=1 Tax=Portunus trituberculatus TaxID=210409 RepID=A0A5B7FAR2_PORTR|nr:Aggrecan core protein [Portunus trituberculatus]